MAMIGEPIEVVEVEEPAKTPVRIPEPLEVPEKELVPAGNL